MWLLHFSVIFELPVQFCPPGEGGGLVQVRDRDRDPPGKHDALQIVQAPHKAQLPSGYVKKNKTNKQTNKQTNKS